MSKPFEFDCQDCGSHVVAYGDGWPPGNRCAACHVIHAIEPGPDMVREHMRAALFRNDPQSLEYWVKIGCYTDEACPERSCYFCGTRYRGPGVYCSLYCVECDS